jgi:hypothetical protein
VTSPGRAADPGAWAATRWCAGLWEAEQINEKSRQMQHRDLTA